MRKLGVLTAALVLVVGCTGMPEGIKPVDNFQLDQYLGTWYEIARLDHSFEKGLSNVTAQYSLREDGGVKVINRGFSKDKQEWNKDVSGKLDQAIKAMTAIREELEKNESAE